MRKVLPLIIIMDIRILQNIREKLLRRLSEVRIKPFSQKALGVGAAGDKTFPIDKIAEDIIISELESSRLSLSIISEEYGRKELHGGGRKVLIDPIDGSKNALAGIPFYCTSLAVAEGDTIGSISIAYVVNLINGDEFLAEKGKGAFLNNEKISTQQDDEFYLVAYEAQVPGRDIPRIIPLLSKAYKTRCLGAIALDLAYLSQGAVSVVVNPSLSRSFDFAGGWLLAKEAGAVFTDTKGDSLDGVDLGLEKSASLLASGNQRLHDKALALLERS
ncbi:MAG TPA: inositol monophosphatase family protein [Thermodesulfovibrionales bacterium]|nr:inositol monophosphatase family protein [Thermodesulfovibrionales bacterium]